MDKKDTGYKNVTWALRFLTTLLHSGITDVVISPGSRSTPLVIAASSISELNTHVILDERSAGFFALGLGKATGRPACLICTSGTAAANYYPAVIEASMSYTPLIVLSADRPDNLQNRHAPQTINQKELFGKYPLKFIQANIREKEQHTVNLASSCVRTAVSDRGIIHVNAPFAKPLQPDEQELNQLLADFCIDISTIENPDEDFLAFELDDVLTKLQSSKKPVIIAGPATIVDGFEQKILKFLAESSNIPIVAESVSGMRGLSHKNIITFYEAYLRSNRVMEELEADFILRIGFPPISIALTSYLKKSKAEQWILSHARMKPDPDNTSTKWIQLPTQSGTLQTTDVKINDYESWLKKWMSFDKSARGISSQFKKNSTEFTDGHVFQTFTNCISEYCDVFVSNSLPVRDLDLFGTNYSNIDFVYHNRGASGIDGITSTACGVSAGSTHKSWLLTGDLAFLHDTTGLMTLANSNLNVIVINNNGGNIFRMLPVYTHQHIYTDYFETPQNANIKKLCEAFGIEHVVVHSAVELNKAIKKRETETEGSAVIECVTNPDASQKIRKQIWNHQREQKN